MMSRTPLFSMMCAGLLACSSGSSTSSPSDHASPAAPAGDGAGGESDDAGTAATSGGSDEAGAPAGDPYKTVFDAVDKASIDKLLNDATGGNTVTVDGASTRLTERWSPAGKARFRAFWKQYFTALGMTVNELTFPIPNLVGETTGHNMEAVLPGASPDSVVIIVHYDSVGIKGKETQNPAVDDDGSGLAIQMEAARIFAGLKGRTNTVRFVAADYEEISDNLDGDVAYVAYLQREAKAKGFKILVASDDDQTGWSCWDEDVKLCGAKPPAANSTFLMISCSGDKKNYAYPELAKGIAEVAAAYSTMKVTAVCDGSGDTDHYPFWQAGIPGYVIEEYGDNPHYDDTGNDTYKTINVQYLFQISQIQIAYQAKLIGLGK